MAYKRVLLPVGLDKNGNPIAKQIGGKSEAERFMSGLQAAIASGSSSIKSPIKQGLIQSLGVYFITFVTVSKLV